MNTTVATLRLFWQHIRRYPRAAGTVAAVVPVAVFATEFLSPLLAAEILNKLAARDYVPGDLWGSFGVDLVVYALVTLLAGIIPWRVVVYFAWTLEARVLRDLSQRVFGHLLQQSANFHSKSFGGSLVSQATKLNSAYEGIFDTTAYGTYPLIAAVMWTSILLWSRAPLFVILLLVLCAVFVAATAFATKRLHRRSVAESRSISAYVGQLADAVTNVMAIKSFASGSAERKRFAEATERTRTKSLHLMRGTLVNETSFSVVNGLIAGVAMIMATAGVTVWGAEVGTVFLIFTYSNGVLSRLWDFSIDSLRRYTRSFGDAREMVEILNTEPTVVDPVVPEEPRISTGAIAFRDVTFAHDGERGPLFNNFTLDISAGEKVGLVGHSGSGKTTLAKLLLRFGDINSGEILIDGQNISRITQDDLRRHIAYVPQEPLLFHRTIAENIGYGQPDASDEEIRRAAAKAHAAEFIETLPDGYETLVGERGVKLSGGQRQRIAIARAMIKRAPILLLDEATSALDSDSERLIQQALGELMADRTTVVIAHRLSTIQRMDRIVVLEKGRIAEQGTHDELRTYGGTYAALWTHQSGGFV